MSKHQRYAATVGTVLAVLVIGGGMAISAAPAAYTPPCTTTTRACLDRRLDSVEAWIKAHDTATPPPTTTTTTPPVTTTTPPVTTTTTTPPVTTTTPPVTTTTTTSSTTTTTTTTTTTPPPGTIAHGRDLTSTNIGPEAAGCTNPAPWPSGKSRDITVAGSVLDCFQLPTTGPLNVMAANVRISRCLAKVTSPDFYVVKVDSAARDTIVEDCRFQPAAVSAPPVSATQAYQQGVKVFGGARGLTVRRTEFWGGANPIEFEPDNSTVDHPVIVDQVYIHDAPDASDGSSDFHHDGVLSSYAAGWVTVSRSRITSLGNTNAIAFQSTGGQWHDCTLTDNLFAGYGWTLNLGDSYGATRFTITGNEYSNTPAARWGPVAGNLSASTWRGNTYMGGKFWWPGDSKGSAGHDGDYVG